MCTESTSSALSTQKQSNRRPTISHTRGNQWDDKKKKEKDVEKKFDS